MVNCKECGKEIAQSAKSCPNCGAKNKKPIFKKWWFWVIIVILVGTIGSNMEGNDDATTSLTSQPASSSASTTMNQQESKPASESKPTVPAEYLSALVKAELYANEMNMSKDAVYDQLVSEAGEKFLKEEAQYAIENVKSDWKASALAKAKMYQDTMAMSPAAIRDQLVSTHGEKFTEEEADYAIKHLND